MRRCARSFPVASADGALILTPRTSAALLPGGGVGTPRGFGSSSTRPISARPGSSGPGSGVGSEIGSARSARAQELNKNTALW